MLLATLSARSLVKLDGWVLDYRGGFALECFNVLGVKVALKEAEHGEVGKGNGVGRHWYPLVVTVLWMRKREASRNTLYHSFEQQ